MIRILMFALLASACWSADTDLVELRLKDGRVLHGAYDAEKESLLLSGSTAVLRVQRRDIASSEPWVDPEVAVLARREADQKAQDAAVAQQEKADATAKEAAMRAAAMKADRERREAIAASESRDTAARTRGHERAKYWADRNLMIDPHGLTDIEVDARAEVILREQAAATERAAEARRIAAAKQVESQNRATLEVKQREEYQRRIEAQKDAMEAHNREEAEERTIKEERRIEQEKRNRAQELTAILFLLFGVMLLLLPPVIAHKRNHHHRLPISIISSFVVLFYGVGLLRVAAGAYSAQPGLTALDLLMVFGIIAWIACLTWATWPGLDKSNSPHESHQVDAGAGSPLAPVMASPRRARGQKSG